MLYGRVLRPPSYGATLESLDLSGVEAMKDVVVVRDGQFVGFAAPSLYRATEALQIATETASWKAVPHPSSKTIHAYLKEHARTGRPNTRGSTETAFADAAQTLSETDTLAYIQH